MANQLIYGRLLNNEDIALPHSKVTLITGDITVVATTDTFTNGDFEFTVDSETSSVKFRVSTFNSEGTETIHTDVESESYNVEDISAPENRLTINVNATPLSTGQGPKGDTGPQGPKGDDGAPGPSYSERNTKITLNNGWHRFAIGSGNRHFNSFYLIEQTGDHQHTVIFNAGIHYSKNPTINVLGQSSYNNGGGIKKIRIVKKGDYDPVYLEVYFSSTFLQVQNCQATKIDSNGGNDWTLQDFTPGNIPSGYSSMEITIQDAKGINTSEDINSNLGYKVGGQPVIDNNGNWVGSPTGLKGNDGAPGRGIQDIELQNDSLQITYTDSQTTSIDLSELNMATPKTYTVEGIVVDENGIPLYNHPVKAFHRKDNTDISLTDDQEITTSKSGEYKITIPESVLKENNIEQLDLVVKVYDSGNDLLVSSPLIINAKTEEKVNLADTEEDLKGIVEYKFFDGRLRAKIDSLTSDDLNKSTALNDLAKETNSTLEEVGQFIQAEKVAQSIGVDKELTFGLIKNGNLDSLADLITIPKSEAKAAIQAGVDAGNIDATIADQDLINTYVDGLRLKAIDVILDPDQGDNNELNSFMTAANLTTIEQKRAFLDIYLEHGADSTIFWTEVGNNSVLSPIKQSLENRTELIALTEEPILSQDLIDKGKTASSLVGITASELKDTLDASLISWDVRFEGETEADKKNNYTNTLLKRIENGNPTGVFSSRIKSAGDARSSNMDSFLSANTSFKFEGAGLRSFLSEDEHKDAIKDLNLSESDELQLVEDLEAMQRLFKVAPINFKYEAVKPMFDNGLKSATDIYSMGKANFLESDFFNDRVVSEEVFLLAEQQAAVLMHLFAENSQQLNALVPQVIRSNKFNSEDEKSQLPDLESLFGSQDVCACKHCRSVYSPAAYMVDLLNWLQHAKSTNDSAYANLKTIIDERRPEIEHILLTCENTNTPLPYIDLVNEVLEYAIASEFTTPITNASDYLKRQTTYPTAYLKAHPEHLNVKVYDYIKTSVYPFTASFDLFDAESKIYFEHLGIDHATLLEKFNSSSNVSGDVAGIELGLNPLEKSIITGTSGHTFSQFFNNQTESNLQTSLRLTLDTTGLDFKELETYLEVNYVTKSLSVTPAIGFEDDCDTSQATINFREKEFTRMMRFERLKRALDWTVEELDGVLSKFIPGSNEEINDATLSKISLIQKFSKKYDLEPLEVLTWFTDVSTNAYGDIESYYIRTFINKSVNNPSASIITSLAGASTTTSSTIKQVFDPSATGYQTEKIFAEGVLPVVLAATRLTEEEIRLIIPSTVHNTIETSVSNLSYCLRMASIKEALGISMADLTTYLSIFPSIKITSSNTFSLNTAKTKEFIEFVDNIIALEVSGDDLNYMFGSNTNEAVYYDEEYWYAKLKTIHSALNDFNTTFFDRGSDIRQWTFNLVNQFIGHVTPGYGSYSEQDAEEFFKVMDGTSAKGTGVDETDSNEQIHYFVKVVQVIFGADFDTLNLSTSNDVGAVVLEYCIDSSFSSTYITPSSTGKIQERYSIIFNDSKISDFIADTLRKVRHNIVKETISDQFPTILQDDSLFLNCDISEELVSSDFTNETISNLHSTFGSYCKSYTRSYFILDKLGIKGFDQKAFLSSFTQTDVYSPSSTTSNVSHFVNELSIIIDNNSTSNEKNSLFNILGKARQAYASNSSYTLSTAFQDDLYQLKGWSEINTLIGGTYLGTINYADYSWYTTVRTVAEASWRSELKLEMLKQVTGSVSLSSHTALALVNACKSKYGNEKWSEIAVEFRDVLRKQQRDALADFIQYNSAKNFKDRFDLYEYFLIDTEMDPCRMTSRIKQANSTIQLFVQRILLNLEQPATLSEGNSNEWEWRKNYRVWEANRKVFLYPENWIEPELRDDQTPFFQEFMDEIMQSGITNENALDAYHNYLTKLDMVAELEVMQHYYDEDKDELHVVARGNTQPYIYYYRKWVDRSRWTPWEKIELDIESDHVAPIVFRNRLLLFWMEHAWELKEDEILEKEDTPTKVAVTYFNWSEYKNSKWQKRNRFNQGLKTFPYVNKYTGFEDLSYRFELWNNNDLLRIVCQRTTGVPPFQMEYYGHFSLYNINNTPKIYQGFSTANHFPFGEFYGYIENNGNKLHVNHEGPEVPKTKNGDVNLLAKTMNRDKTKVIVGSRRKHKTGIYGDDPFFYKDDINSFFIAKTPLYDTVTTTVKKYIDSSLLASVPISPLNPQYAYAKAKPSGQNDEIFYNKNSAVSTTKDGQNVYIDNTGYYVLETKTIQDTEPSEYKFQFFPFDHKQVETIVEAINKHGIDGLFKPIDKGWPSRYRTQFQTTDQSTFVQMYAPYTNYVHQNYPVDNIDFSASGSYSVYNWELFFHLPMMVATELTNNQQFEDAQKWFHFIFDPTQVVTDEASDQEETRFWNTKPFKTFNGETSINKLMKQLNEQNEEMEKQVAIWRKDPFNPYAIARLRWVAFMKNVVMKYLDMLIAWGDYLFRRDSIESVNEATQVYILAAQILGRRPEKITRDDLSPRSFATLGGLDSFSNTLIAMENTLPIQLVVPKLSDLYNNYNRPNNVTVREVLFFCIPGNPKLAEYWDTVGDRLFKIRHCQNIEGIVRQLPLFEPPIDPAMLVRARANGLSISEALADLNAPMSFYRYGYLYQKAVELTNDVKALGGALLAALEKKDAEEISLLRTSHEKNVLTAVKAIKQQAIDEAKKALESLNKSKEITEERRAHYANKKRTTAREKQQLKKMNKAFGLQTSIQAIEAVAKAVASTPQIESHAAGVASGLTTEVASGEKLARIVEFGADSIKITSSAESHMASILGMRAGHDNRYEDWQFQTKQAAKELEQLAVQIQSAEIRQAMAEAELDNHILQMENNSEIGSIMKDKFSNYKLYGWMVKEISSIYFKAYQLAYDLAKKAEKAYKFDVGYEDKKQYVQFGSWDNLKKGLLAGERLLQDLRTLDGAFTEKHKRKNELTKQVSLAILDPVALNDLRTTGACDFDIPELMYDLDHPGHYMRRIKAVTVSIPAVTGPYTGVTGSLTLLANRFRKNTSGDTYAYSSIEDSRFHHNSIGIQRIATSSGLNDSGMFEMNFNDARFLPFEGAGAISSWRFELPFDGTSVSSFRKFDYSTISDLIVTIHYTSKDGGDSFKETVQTHVKNSINYWLDETLSSNPKGLERVFSLKHEFPTEFHQMLNSEFSNDILETTLGITKNHFPHIFNDVSLDTDKATVLFIAKGINTGLDSGGAGVTLSFGSPDDSTNPSVATDGKSIDLEFTGTVDPARSLTLKLNGNSSNLGDFYSNNLLDSDKIEDIILIMNYKKA